jgi:hypothetical protein
MNIKGEYFERITDLLAEMIRTVSILALAAKLTEATSETERCYLSQALGQAVSGASSPQQSRFNASTGTDGLEFPRNFP